MVACTNGEVDGMIVSANDKRQYRTIQLENGLRVILVSSVDCDSGDGSDDELEDDDDGSQVSEDESGTDESESEGSISDEEDDKKSSKKREKMAAAALAVRVGGFQDPPHICGIAHYTEHMLFMGSEKYPSENEYSEYISKNGGFENAFTETDNTVYYFEVSQPAFAKALDMFANFFVKPLFREDALDREVQAVESEFQLAQVNDESRLCEVFSRLAGEDHPMGRFMWGNIKSLKEMPLEQGFNVREEVVKFYNKYYSAEAMTLAVQSKHSLDELEELVRASFSAVPRRETANITYPTELPFSKSPHRSMLIKVVPIGQESYLVLNWVLPPIKENYGKKALDYLGYVIGHEGKDGIFDQLRNKQWALELSAGCEDDGFHDNEMCCIFTISVELSELGTSHVPEILQIIHQYIHMIRKAGPQQWIWEELKNIAELDFRFQEEDEAHSYVTSLAPQMQRYPKRDYLCADALYTDWDPEYLQKYTDLLTPEQCGVFFSYHGFQKEADTFPLKEPWMGAAYMPEPYPEEWKLMWADDPDFQKSLSFPEPNQFVPTDFTIKETSSQEPDAPPSVILKNSQVKLWYRKDFKFLVPKAHMNFHLISRIPYANVSNAVCVDLVAVILTQVLSRVLNYAEMASLDFEYNGYYSGLTLSFDGFNEKLPLLLNIIVDTLMNFNCSQELFDTIKTNTRKSFYNDALSNKKYCDDIRADIVQLHRFMIAERRKVLAGLTLQDTITVVKQLMSSCFIEAYFHGNLLPDESISIINGITQKLNAKPETEKFEEPYAIIEGENYIRVISNNPEDKNSRIVNYYQYGPAHVHEETLMQVLVAFMEEKCYNRLRTELQLAYDAYCSMNNYRGVIGFVISLSPAASKFTLSHVDSQMDEFVQTMRRYIEELKEDEFDTVRQALIKIKLRVDLSMDEEASRNWQHISQFRYDFNKLQTSAEFLKNLELEQFRKWALKALPSYVDDNSTATEGGGSDSSKDVNVKPWDSSVKKLSVQIVGYGEAALSECWGGIEIWEQHEQALNNKTQKEEEVSDPEIPAMKLVTPLEADQSKALKYVTDYAEFKKTIKYYPVGFRDVNEKFEF